MELPVGTSVRLVRDRRGRFARGRGIGIVLGLIVSVAMVFAVFGDAWVSKELHAVVAQPVYAGITMEAKLDVLKDDVVSRLKQCESERYTEDDGIIIFDSNNKASIGLMQFQKATVQHYAKVLYGDEITAKDAVLIALDDRRATALAKDIIFEVKGGVWNWENCAKRLNLAPEIEVLKKLSN